MEKQLVQDSRAAASSNGLEDMPVAGASINPLFGAGGGALIGGAGSLLRDHLKSEDPNYKRAALVALLGGAIGYGGTHAYNNYG